MSSPESPAASQGRFSPVQLCFGINLGLFLLMLVMVGFGTSDFTTDESWYLDDVPVLDEYGFTSTFLRGLRGPAGPTHTVFHWLFEPWTGLERVPTRLLNATFALLVLCVLGLGLRNEGREAPLQTAFMLMAAPMFLLVSALSLTEIPSLLCFTGSQVLLFYALRADGNRQRALAAITGGLCLAIAISGRQMFAIVAPALIVLFLMSAGRRAVLVLYGVSAAILPMILFWIWQGLVPPLTAYVGGGLVFEHGLLSFAYMAVIVAMINPSWFRVPMRGMLAIAAATVLANLVLGYAEDIPLKYLFKKLLHPELLPIYSRVVNGFLAALALVFLTSLALHVKERKSEALHVYISAAMFLLLLAPVTITHAFALRYIATALPLAIYLVTENMSVNYWTVARMAAGASLGLVMMTKFLYFHS